MSRRKGERKVDPAAPQGLLLKPLLRENDMPLEEKRALVRLYLENIAFSLVRMAELGREIALEEGDKEAASEIYMYAHIDVRNVYTLIDYLKKHKII